MRSRCLLNCHSCLVSSLCLILAIFTPPARAGLDEYVNRAEAVFAWKLHEKKETDQGTIYDLHLVSQTWQDIKWEHQLQVYQPKGVEPNAKMLLWNTGGTAKAGDIALGMELAR